MNIQTFLEDIFGFKELKPFQAQVVDASLMGKDNMVISPTGSGKSLCFQLPALVNEGMTIVFSPLRSLIFDQVEFLKSKGINSALLNGDLTLTKRAKVYDELAKPFPNIKILYSTPESIICNEETKHFMKILHKNGLIARFVLDEAHCITTWGHDFRPKYRKVSKLREEYPGVPIIALTATATEKVQADINDILKLDYPRVFKTGFLRDNLNIIVRDKSDYYDSNGKMDKKIILEEIYGELKGKYKGQSGIIYAHSRKECEDLNEKLVENGIKSNYFHAGLSAKKRNEIQTGWIDNELQVIVATIAFGMGIDKSDVRYVYHYNLPQSIEGYYQEIGRGGRDRELADCIIYYSIGEATKYTMMLKKDSNSRFKKTDNAYFKSKNDEHINNQINKIYDVVNMIENHNDCYHIQLCNYFGEMRKEKLGFCESKCQNCINKGSMIKKNYTDLSKYIIESIMKYGSAATKTKVKNEVKGKFLGNRLKKETKKKKTDFDSTKEWKKYSEEYKLKNERFKMETIDYNKKELIIDRVMIHLIINKYIKENIVKTSNGFWMEKMELYKKSKKIIEGNKKIKFY